MVIIALYSKGRFDTEAGGLAVGDVFGIDRYTSKHKTFEALVAGGALFVVTVRPGDVLWLVAVLEHPKKKDGAWVAERNTTPIRDITDLIPKIEFTSGKGIKVGKGKLGMSLQTPRALSDGDIALLRNGTPKTKKKPNKQGSELDAVAKHLGAGWAADGDALLHKKSGVRFAYVPGGWLRMGFSLDDIYEACCARSRAVTDESDWCGGDEISRARPPHVVKVIPFVTAIEKQPRDNKALAEFRHPSEAELEWIYRRGGAGRWAGVLDDKSFRGRKRWHVTGDMPFGINIDYDEHEICEDAWHGSYMGAPANSKPWGKGNQVYRALHTMWQDDDEEMLSIHAAYRPPGKQDGPAKTFRPTLALQKYSKGKAKGKAPDAIEAERLLNGLRKNDKASRSALAVIASAPADDVRVVVDYLLANLPDDTKVLRKSLELLTALRQYGKPVAPLLDHDDKRVRALAAQVVTYGKNAAALTKRLKKEPDEVVAATIIIGLGMLGKKAPQTKHKLDDVVVIANALAGDVDAGAVARARHVKGMAKLPWFDGYLEGACLDILRKLPAQTTREGSHRARRGRDLVRGRGTLLATPVAV